MSTSKAGLVLLFARREVQPGDRESMREGRFEVRGHITELKPPVDWRMDPVENRSWRSTLHKMQFLDIPLRVYAEEDDADALTIARDLMLDWIGANPVGGETTGDFAWRDMNAGMRASFLGYIRRECRHNDLLDATAYDVLTASVREHAAWLSDDANYTASSNHGLYEDGGLFLLAEHSADLAESTEWRSLAEARLISTLRMHIETDEGLHKEHSPSYHMYTRDLVKRLHEGTGIGGDWLGELAGKLENSASWLVMPDGNLLPFGDTDMVKAPAFTRERAVGNKGLGAFLRTGFAVVREGDSYLAMTCCYHTHAHKQADELSWCLHERGRLIVGEAGRYGYRDEKDPARIYARSSHGHNALIVDGRDGLWRGTPPYGSGLIAAGHGDGWYAVLGHNPLLEEIDHRRLLLYRPGEIVVVVDSLEAAEEHEVVRRLHFGPGVEADALPNRVVARSEGGEDLATLVDWSEADVELSVARGVEEPAMDGWTFPRDLTKLPTHTVTLRARIATGLLVHGVTMSPSSAAGVVAGAGADEFTVAIAGAERSTAVKIGVSGSQLRLTAS